MSDNRSVLGDLPKGVENAMFLRDGWPLAVVCKVLMKTGCVGIGVKRYPPGDGYKPSPEEADRAALEDAMRHLGAEPPDYSELHDHINRMKAAAGRARGSE